MDDNKQFETLCMNGKTGYCYEEKLLVEVDKAQHFDDAVIRLITKCGSILTQLRSLGNYVDRFTIDAVGTRSCLDDDDSTPIFGIKGGSAALSRLWNTLKEQDYTGVVAISRLKINAIPKNGANCKYNLMDLVEILLSHIHGNFMFQKYSSEFIKPPNDNFKEEDDYILYLAYKICPDKVVKRSSHSYFNDSKVDKRTSAEWSINLNKKQRHESGDSTTSSNCSYSSGGSSTIFPPFTNFSAQHIIDAHLRGKSISSTVSSRTAESDPLLKLTAETTTYNRPQTRQNMENTSTTKSISNEGNHHNTRLRTSVSESSLLNKDMAADSNQPLSGRVLRRPFPKS